MALNVSFMVGRRAEKGLPIASPVDATSVAVGGSVARSAACPDGREIVRVHAAEDTHILIAAGDTATPTAAAGGGVFVPAGRVEYFAIAPGDKVAAIAPT